MSKGFNEDSKNLPMKRMTNELEKSSMRTVDRSVVKGEEAVDSILSRRESFLERFFPNSVARAKIKGELSLVVTEFTFRERALRMVRETQMQAMQEAFNQFLVQGKAQIRSDTAAFMTEKRQDLQVQINSLFSKFIVTMEKEYEEAETIKNDLLRNSQIERLDEQVLGFKNLIDKLVKDFENIASEAIKA